jgi:hypothetical protein
MSTIDDEEKRQRVADALYPILEDGDFIQVACEEGEILISEPDFSVCRERHPRLFGRMLSLNAELSETGGNVTYLLLLAAGAFCLGLHLRWWDAWFGDDAAERMRSIWFYLFVFAITLKINGLISARLEGFVYRRRRDDLLALLREEDLDRDVLLSIIEGEDSVAHVARQLKLDADAGRRNG